MLTIANYSFLDGASEGYIKIPRAALSSSEGNWDIMVEIPRELDSFQTLKYCGFKRRAANTILQSYRENEAEFPGTADLLDFMTGYIDATPEDVWEDPSHDWDTALKAMGMAAEARQAVMDPEFEDIRRTQTGKQSAKGTVKQRMETLQKIDKHLTQNKDRISSRGQQNPQNAWVYEKQNLASGDVVLLKGGTVDKLGTAFPQTQTVIIRLLSIFSDPPTDFASSKIALYLTQSRKCAMRHAYYAQRCAYRGAELSDAGILHIGVPWAELADSRTLAEKEMRSLVWSSRGADKLTPQGLAEEAKYAGEKILAGKICDMSDEQLRRQTGPDQMRIMDLDGHTPDQHVVMETPKAIAMSPAAVGKTWLEILPQQFFPKN